MPRYEVTGPDGARYEIEAPDDAAAATATQQFFADSSQTTVPEPEGEDADLMRALQIGVQGAGRAGADILGMPGDTANSLADIVMGGADKVAEQFGGNVDFRFGPSPLGSDAIANAASAGTEALTGIDIIEPEDMSTSERLGYNINRFGTGAVAGGGALARGAASRFAPGPVKTPKAGDSLMRAYADDPRRALRGDAAGGAGAGAAITASEQGDFGAGQPLVDLGAMLAGGAGGALVSDAPSILSNLGRSLREGMTVDPNIPLDEALNSTSRRTTRRAAEFAQGMASDPRAAAERIGARADEARAASDPSPTSGLASDDIGLISAEQANRVRNRVPFAERDRAVTDASSRRVDALRDPNADIEQARAAAQARPGELSDARNAEAIPLLREAEASGAEVDLAPVIAVIDEKLSTAKRPAVRNALMTARDSMNRVGSDEIDTSVAGLYETRKTISDLIEGRGERPTDRFAKTELIEVRKALDEQIKAAEPRFGEYLDSFREGSRPLNELNNSRDVARLMENDPRNVAQQLLGGRDYASPERMRQVTSALQGKPEALRGWKEAVSQVLSDKVRNVGGALSRGADDGPVSIAKMRTVFRQHEDALAEVYSPQEMESLRRAHEALAPLENRRVQATTGSPTAENRALTGAWDALGAAMTVKFGAVHAGMVMHRLRRLANLMPGLENMTLDNKALQLVNRMWFEPDIAKHLLETPIDQVQTPRWNRRLGVLLGVGEAARPEQEPVDETIDAVTRDDEQRNR